MMLRVLMVLEDYSELMYLQSLLKKLGFDVEAIQNPKGFHDGILKINPDLLILTGNGRVVKGMELTSTLRRPRRAKVILMGTAGKAGPEADAWADSPVIATAFLATLAEVCGLDGAMLAEKYRGMQEKDELERQRTLRMNPVDDAELGVSLEADAKPNHRVLSESTLTNAARSDRYKKFLSQSSAPESHGFTAKQVAAQVRDLRKDEGSLADLERERREFVKHLFEKKKT